jgi:type IV secretion system protein VirB2
MRTNILSNIQSFSKENGEVMALALLAVFLILLSPGAFAQDAFGAACEKVNTFFSSFQTILKVVSAGIVTIAIVFAGYQIAFAHKRISDVAPILIGGLLIGGAATIASWFVDGFGQDDCAITGLFKAVAIVAA